MTNKHKRGFVSLHIGINALYLLPGKVGGSETYLRNLVKWLPTIGHEHRFSLFVNRESADIFRSSPEITVVPCQVSAANRPGRIFWEQVIFPFVLKQNTVDILLSAGMTTPILCPATSVLMLFDLQHVNQPRNFPLLYLPFLRSIIYSSAKSADGVLTLSNQAKNDIIQSYHLPADRIEVTYLAVDHDAFHPATVSDSAAVRMRYSLPEHFILYAASSLPHKNHVRLLKAFQRVLNRVPDIKLVLIGARDKGEEELNHQIKLHNLEKEVILLGWLPFEEVPAVYRACELFVFPTLHEGFGLPIIEAMASGVPVVCSNIEPLTEVAGDAAHFVDPLSFENIAAGILAVLRDKATSESLISRGLIRAQEFTWRKTVGQTLSFLKAVHAARSGLQS